MQDEESVTLGIGQVRDQIGLITQAVEQMDLEGFLAMIDRAEILGPLLEPRQWEASEDGMAEWKLAAQALLKFQEATRPSLEAARQKRGLPVTAAGGEGCGMKTCSGAGGTGPAPSLSLGST